MRPASPPLTPARPLHVVLALGTVYVVWGSTYLAIKLAIADIPPMLMAGTRFALAGSVLFAWSARRGDVAGDRITRRRWGAAFGVAALMLLAGNGAVTLAEERLDSGLAALLVATVPLWMAIFSRLREGTRLRPRAWAGLALGFGGVAGLVGPGGEALHLPSALLVLGGAACWAYGSLLSRTVDLPRRPLVATAMEMLAAAALFVLAGALRGELAAFDPTTVGPSALGALLYLATAGSIVAFSAYVWLLRNAPPSVTSTYAYVNPAVAVGLGWLVLAEPVTAKMLGAGCAIVVAVALIVTASRAPVPAQATSGGDVGRWRRSRSRLRHERELS